eukprot:SAG11_NODE_348_length_10402_cov_8.763467_6_plen_91_part_00
MLGDITMFSRASLACSFSSITLGSCFDGSNFDGLGLWLGPINCVRSFVRCRGAAIMLNVRGATLEGGPRIDGGLDDDRSTLPSWNDRPDE